MVVCVELVHSSLGDWKRYIHNSSCYHHQIRSINFWHCCHIFHGHVPKVVAHMSWAAGLFAHYTTSLSSLCRCILRYWTSKILARYMLPSVCLRLSHFCQLSFMQYMGMYVFNLHISLFMTVVRICILYLILSYLIIIIIIIIIKFEVWPICHCLGLGHETIICAVCLSIFFMII